MLAFIFPGQGSQNLGMAQFLYDNFPIAKQTLEEASDALKQDFKKLLFDGPQEDLNLTENTQPALLLASTMYHRSLKKEYDLDFTLSAGHSLGEYSAFVASEVISFSEALKLTKARGLAMQEAVPLGEGAMLAVLGGTDTEVKKACEMIDEIVEPANFNAPGQVVISGSKKGIEVFQQLDTKEIFGKKWKMIPLNVSAPFHCQLMRKAQQEMTPLIENSPMKEAQKAIIQNYTAKEESDVGRLKSNLIQQISGSVRWSDSVLRMKELGVTKVLEVGPGKVLSGLVKKIDSQQIKSFNINNLEEFHQVAKELSLR